jgi:hypothetical protein
MKFVFVKQAREVLKYALQNKDCIPKHKSLK